MTNEDALITLAFSEFIGKAKLGVSLNRTYLDPLSSFELKFIRTVKVPVKSAVPETTPWLFP
jgi:hypothetical protein